MPAAVARARHDIVLRGTIASGLSLRPCTGHDRAFERALFETARSDAALLAAWPAPMRGAFLDQQFQCQSEHYALVYPRAERAIVTVAGTPAGRVILDRCGLEWCLIDIALQPAIRGRGLGARLIAHMQTAARRRGASMTLTVEMHNRAQRLYRRLGFRPYEAAPPHLFMRWRPPAS